MLGLWDSDLELVIQSGFIFAPLLLDPSVEQELRTRSPGTLHEANGTRFVKTVSVRSLVENYATLNADDYAALRSACAGSHDHDAASPFPARDEMLRTILFQVLPHFVRRGWKRQRRPLSQGDVLNLIARKIRVPGAGSEDSADVPISAPARERPGGQRGPRRAMEPLAEGKISAARLRDWIRKAVEASIREEGARHLDQTLKAGERLRGLSRMQVAVLRHVAREGALEIDGFGFSRLGRGDEYVVYKRTGEYALKDYYGRIYLFPDCRVAVSTILPLKPFVMETYKHPFLEGHDSGQPICLRTAIRAREYAGAAVINALEEGVNALLYGYSSRRRNGYHSLEGMARHAGAPGPEEFEAPPYGDYPVIRSRYLGPISFEDYRVSREHPKIASQQVAITNDATP
jgi:hypothetical protein